MTPAGRPHIGTPINIRLGNDLLAQVDAHADTEGIKRAEAIRQLVRRGLRGTTMMNHDFEPGFHDNECTHSDDGTWATYCGGPRAGHPSDYKQTMDEWPLTCDCPCGECCASINPDNHCHSERCVIQAVCVTQV